MENFSFKELYDVRLKLTSPLEINGISMKTGETIAKFDYISVAGLQQNKSQVAAHGGFDDRAHVFWETTKSMSMNFSQGIFSETHLQLLYNANLITSTVEVPILLTTTEEKETDENGLITLDHQPGGQIFVYNAITGLKETIYLKEDKNLTLTKAFTDMVVEYEYAYEDIGEILKIGQPLLNGFLSLEGRTKIKEDVTGVVKTGVIKIPKLKIVSSLNIRLGKEVGPTVATFIAEGIPTGGRGNTYVMDFYLLNDDIDSDF